MMENVLEKEDIKLIDRVVLLEKIVTEQNDELICLKSALADCIRRIDNLEQIKNQPNQTTRLIKQPPPPTKSNTPTLTQKQTPINKQSQNDKINKISSTNLKQISVKSKLGSLKTLSQSQTSLSSIDSSNNNQKSFNKETGLIKFYLRGRPINIHLPLKLQDQTGCFNFNPKELIQTPKESLALEWVYGYRGKDCRSNIYLLSTGEIVYFIAGVAILYNIQLRSQRFYLGHTDDIKSIAIHPDRVLVATGQVAGHDHENGKPHVRIWDSVNLKTLKTIGLNKNEHFQNSISCLSFSRSDDHIAIVDDGPERILSVWNWQKCIKLTSQKCYSDSVLVCEYHPYEHNIILTAGKQHLIFWDLNKDSKLLTKKSALFDKHEKPKFILCLTFLSNGDVVTGDTDSNVLIWSLKDIKINRCLKNAHFNGGVYSILILNNDLILTGGKDGKIIEWSRENNYEKTSREFQIPNQYGGVRVLCNFNTNMFVIGTTKNCIFQANFELNSLNCLMNSHYEELWGLTCSKVNDTNFLTSGNDKYLCLWDSLSHSLIWSIELDDKLHCVDTHPNHDLAAIGLEQSKWIVFDLFERKVVHNQTDGSEQIECIKYSPNGLYLACGSRDNNIYLYSLSEDGRKYTKIGKLSGHSSFITHIDWSNDSQYLMSNSGDYEILIWNVINCKQVTQAQIIREIEWKTSTCTLSFNTLGIWSSSDKETNSTSPNIDGTDINASCASHSKSLLVSVDDFGKVNLFKYPCSSFRAEKKVYNGHSSHVTNCEFVCNESRLITTGGNDMAVFQWNIIED